MLWSLLDRDLAGLFFDLPGRSLTIWGSSTPTELQVSLPTHLPAVVPLAGVDPCMVKMAFVN